MGNSKWKRRIQYFVVGLTVALTCAVLDILWIDIVPYHAFDRQPEWLKALNSLVGWLPWLLVAGMIVFRLWKRRSIPVASYLLGTATPLALLLSWVLLGSVLDSMLHNRDFDAQLWRAHEGVGHDPMWPPRLTMVDDLIGSGELDGLSRDQVVALLGPPELGETDEGNQYIYWLGPERGYLRIDSEWIAIDFGDDGKVKGYELMRD